MKQLWDLPHKAPLAAMLLASSALAMADDNTLLVEGSGSLGTTTEDTLSYTTGETRAATGLSLSPQETPQSVTVLTRQRMDDQQLTSVQSALEATTGITSRTLDSERVDFFSRGFSIDSFQFDGVPTSFVDGASFLDTAFYDRIEVVRGATGLLTGAGNPGASVNLVRKRPSDSFQAQASVSAGSWDNYRGMMDVSTPLTDDGRVRARVVGSYQDRHSWLDRYQQKKQALYAVIEADLTDNTTLSVGYDAQIIKPTGTTWGGVPRWYSDGSETQWSRSVNSAADWSHWNNTLRTAFASLDQHFDNGWSLKTNLTQQRTHSDAKLFSSLGYPDRSSGEGVIPIALASNATSRQNSLDMQASGPFSLLGRQHEVVMGVMASKRVTDENSSGFVYPSAAMGSLYQWNGDYPEPDFSQANWTRTHTEIIQRGVYSALRFSLADPVKLIVGARVSQYKINQSDGSTDFNDEKKGAITPYVGVVYALNPTYSLYTSYTTIFNPQTYRDSDNHVLKPTRGNNREVGIKGRYLDGRLNASLSLFDTHLDNVATLDSGALLPDGSQAYKAVNGTTSKGIEVDVQGEILPGWNMSLGLANYAASESDGSRLNPQLPRTTARLFSTWQLPGRFYPVTVGAGVNWQSSSWLSATSPSGSTRATQKSYALAALMARYSLTPQADVAVNINNLFDQRYTVMNGFYNQVLYGEPRNVTLTVNYRF